MCASQESKDSGKAQTMLKALGIPDSEWGSFRYLGINLDTPVTIRQFIDEYRRTPAESRVKYDIVVNEYCPTHRSDRRFITQEDLAAVVELTGARHIVTPIRGSTPLDWSMSDLRFVEKATTSTPYGLAQLYSLEGGSLRVR